MYLMHLSPFCRYNTGIKSVQMMASKRLY